MSKDGGVSDLLTVESFSDIGYTIPVSDEGMESLDLAGGGQCLERGGEGLAFRMVG